MMAGHVTDYQLGFISLRRGDRLPVRLCHLDVVTDYQLGYFERSQGLSDRLPVRLYNWVMVTN